MKTHKVKIFVIVLLSLTIIIALIHLNMWKPIADGTLLISAQDKSVTVDISKFEYEQVTGIRVNGKGEEIEIDALGISLKDVLTQVKIQNYTKVVVISDDSYKAEILAEEIEVESKAFLIVEEEKTLRLVVFGDINSKRSVSNVVQIVVE